jgi:hypothetical protein
VRGRRSWLLAGLVCAGLGASVTWAVQSGASTGSATAAVVPNAHCGEIVNASLTLNADLSCPTGVALIINNNSVVLNLGGHHIDGEPGGQLGVGVHGSSDTVENGVISGFASEGVDLSNSAPVTTSDTVSAVRIIGGVYGIVDGGRTNKITNSTVTGSTYGIYGRGSGGTYSGDHELNNIQYGLYLTGAKLVVSSNVADGNAIYGIYDAGTADTLTKNTANFNGNDGIFIQGDPTVIDGGGNLARGNDYTSGATPEQCYGVVCT